MSHRALVSIAGLFFAASLAGAQEVAEFKQNIAQGTTWKFDQSQDSDMTNTASFQGQQQQFGVKSHATRAGTVEVLEASNGTPTKMKITFDQSCTTSQETNGQSQAMPFPFAGQTVTITRDAGGNITDDFNGQADAASKQEVHEYFEHDVQLYPKKPIKVGEQWSGDPQVLGRSLGLDDPRDRGGLTCQLLSIDNTGGKRIANVKVSVGVFKFQGDLQTQLVSQGVAQVDLATGHALSSDLKGNITMSGKQQAPGQGGQPMSIDIDGKGTVTIKSSSEFTSGGGGGTAGGDAPTPSPFPSPTPSPAPNPLSTDASDSLPGNYSDGKLSLEISANNTSYVGKLKMGGKEFPVTADKAGDGISGDFSSGASHFPFKAKLSGDTLDFTTGKTTYHLKKDAANPLDSGGGNNAPPNPLSPGGSENGPHALNVPGGFDVLATSDHGAAWIIGEPGQTAASKALASAIKKAGSAFDAVPKSVALRSTTKI